jgi:hypothetical protein
MYIRETLAVISLITHPASDMATPAQSRTETVNNQNENTAAIRHPASKAPFGRNSVSEISFKDGAN